MNARVKALGEYLVEEDVLTPEQLPSVLARQLEHRARGRLLQFGEVVVEMGLATPDQVQGALDRQQRERSRGA